MTKRVELEAAIEACPFCGGEAAIGTIRYSDKTVAENEWTQDTFYKVNCIVCGANNLGLVGHSSAADAIKKWNRRCLPPVDLAAVDEGKLAEEMDTECAKGNVNDPGWMIRTCARVAARHGAGVGIVDSPCDVEVEADWADFWKPIICEHGPIDLGQIKRELYDWHVAMGEVSKVYEHVSGGKFSKPNTAAVYVIQAHEDTVTRDAGLCRECGEYVEAKELAEAVRQFLANFAVPSHEGRDLLRNALCAFDAALNSRGPGRGEEQAYLDAAVALAEADYDEDRAIERQDGNEIDRVGAVRLIARDRFAAARPKATP